MNFTEAPAVDGDEDDSIVRGIIPWNFLQNRPLSPTF
jgi:hypothetical protein